MVVVDQQGEGVFQHMMMSEYSKVVGVVVVVIASLKVVRQTDTERKSPEQMYS